MDTGTLDEHTGRVCWTGMLDSIRLVSNKAAGLDKKENSPSKSEASLKKGK
jgi:hypothetical protein